MDLTPKISITPGWSIVYCCTPATSNNDDDNDDDGYDGFLWSAPSIKVVTLGGSKDFFAGQAAETPTTACSDDTDDCYSFNLQCSPPPSKMTAVQHSEVGVPQITPAKTCEPSESSSEQPSTPFIEVVEIITPKSRKLQDGYAVKRTSKFNRSTTEEGSVTSEDDDDDDDISDQDDELTYYLYPDKNLLDENQSSVKSDASNGNKNKANDVIELPIDAPKLGLLHYLNRSAFSDITNKDKGADEDETSDEDKFYDSLESLGDESDDDSSTNNTQQISSPLIISSSNRKNEFRPMTTR